MMNQIVDTDSRMFQLRILEIVSADFRIMVRQAASPESEILFSVPDGDIPSELFFQEFPVLHDLPIEIKETRRFTIPMKRINIDCLRAAFFQELEPVVPPCDRTEYFDGGIYFPNHLPRNLIIACNLFRRHCGQIFLFPALESPEFRLVEQFHPLNTPFECRNRFANLIGELALQFRRDRLRNGELSILELHFGQAEDIEAVMFPERLHPRRILLQIQNFLSEKAGIGHLIESEKTIQSFPIELLDKRR